ncbi:MAG TPA: hypothetical protein VES42_04755 [Pilimelia sp.]|nr:hypothetical protein [Pilimelia sp.]
MSSTQIVTPSPPPPSQSPAPGAGLATTREDLLTVVFGACLILGAVADGWAHQNILADVQEDGFFTPWHGLLYSGFTATAAWTFFLAYRRRDRAPRWWRDGWPAGYRLGALGVAIFSLAGLLDMVWHTVFGVETTIDALLSPSHLLLCAGSVLLLTSPLRSWWAAGPGGGRSATGVLSMALATTSVAVFMLYGSAFDYAGPVLPFSGEQGTAGYTAASLGVASYVITTGLLLVPLLLIHRRRWTPGAATALVAWASLFPMATREFPQPETGAALAAIAAAAVVDWLLGRLDRARGATAPGRLPIAGAVFGTLVWSAHLLGLHLGGRIEWPVELWTGSVVSAAAVGALLGLLAGQPSGQAPAGAFAGQPLSERHAPTAFTGEA